MDKNRIKDFFNEKATNWDAESLKAKAGAKKIITKFTKYINEKSVLDIGCGTGVLTKDLINAGAKSITGIDISNKMIEIAKNKFLNNSNVQFFCKDITEWTTTEKFDIAIIYNAYPHLEKNSYLVNKIYSLLKNKGRCIIAHGTSKEEINSHHKAHALKVSSKLMTAENESLLWKSKFKIEETLDNKNLYYILMTKN